MILFADYDQKSIWWQKTFEALLKVEYEFTEHLIKELKDNNVEGDFVEFGIFQGGWLNNFHDLTERVDFPRRIWGFDSFKGLSKPDETRDTSFWKEGMYACSKAEVEKNIQFHSRPRFKLVEGFFAESFPRPDAQELGKVCFARIDCDIYEPALDCLRFLESRLTDGAILVFDDWAFSPEFGETRAFFEWVEQIIKHLKFEYIMSGVWGTFTLRVTRP